jgi:2-methylisocitrate lyase-like PEP mutase family enzyme
MIDSYGKRIRHELSQSDIIPFIGVYDVFSASIAGKSYDSIFISGFGFAASYYGLPDIGFISWSDITSFVQRVRTILPDHHILVDIDDGYADVEVACHVVSQLEALGASGVIIEDQKRPRRCGHFEGKQLMEIDEFVMKLEKVLTTRKDLFVVARTDATDINDILNRVAAFSKAGADAILVDAIKDLELIKKLKSITEQPLAYNQIAGGKSPSYSLNQLRSAGVSLVVYSTPCLFPVQSVIEESMNSLKQNDGLLEDKNIGLKECTEHLNKNLARRDRS